MHHEAVGEPGEGKAEGDGTASGGDGTAPGGFRGAAYVQGRCVLTWAPRVARGAGGVQGGDGTGSGGGGAVGHGKARHIVYERFVLSEPGRYGGNPIPKEVIMREISEVEI